MELRTCSYPGYQVENQYKGLAMNVQRTIVKMRQTKPVGSGKLTSIID